MIATRVFVQDNRAKIAKKKYKFDRRTNESNFVSFFIQYNTREKQNKTAKMKQNPKKRKTEKMLQTSICARQ